MLVESYLIRGKLMIKYQSLINLFIYLFGPLLLVLFLPLIPAFSAPITMEYSLGFDGFFQLNKWAPLHVMLENRGKTINGTLEVIVTSGNEYLRNVHDTTYSMDAELPTNSKKLFSFTILLDSFTHPIIIRLRDGEKIILSHLLNLRPNYTTKSLVLFLGGKTASDFASLLPERVLPIISRARFLPESWYGYDGVEMLILHASALKNLRERQFTALTEWLKKGGYLIIAGWLNYGSLLDQRTRRLLPVNIFGTEQVFELNSLERFCGQRLTSLDPFLILKAEIEDSEVLLKQDDIPLITRKGIGLGRVIFLAFDYQNPPFSEWTGRRSFWSKILALKPPGDSFSSELEEQEILSSMTSGIPSRFPNFLLVLPFLAVYVILVHILIKRVEKNIGHRRKEISCLMTIIVVFSVASYWLFFYKNALKDLSHNSFIQMKISGQNMMASSKYIVGLYSLQNGDYRLSLGPTFRPITPILPVKAEDETLHCLTLHENIAGQTFLISLDRWSPRFFKVNSMMYFPIRGGAFLDDQDLVIMIENMTPHTIIDCWVYFANRLFFFGNIVPSKKHVKRLARSVIAQKELFQTQAAGFIAKSIAPKTPTSLLETMQKNLMKGLLLSIHSRYNSRRDALHLFGWIRSDVVPTSIASPGASGEGAALLEWEIPLSFGQKNIKAEVMPDSPLTCNALSGSRIIPLKDLS